MKDYPALDKVMGTSHRRIARVDLYDASGLIQADLPVTDGDISARANSSDRWQVRLTLAGTEWVPQEATDPLSGFAGTYLEVWLGAEVDTVDELVPVCRVIPVNTRVRTSVEDVEVEVDCLGLGGWLDLAAPSRLAAKLDETCQEMIVRVVQEISPSGYVGQVDDTSTPVPVPLGFYIDNATPAEVIRSLVSIANITTYFDAAGTLVIRPPLPNTPNPVRTIAIAQDLSTIDQETGRLGNFANVIEVTYQPAGASDRQRVSADWTYRTLNGAPSQGQIRETNNGDGTHQWRVHVRDAGGKNRRRGLDRIETGDILEALASTGGRVLAEVRSAGSQGTYFTFDVEYISTEAPGVANNDVIELAVFASLEDNIVGTAEESTGVLGTAKAGRVVRTETVIGNVTQAQADARAQSLLQTALRAWQTYVIEAIPDPRLEPDDDITLVTPDATLECRITQIDLPIGADRLMSVGVRTFPGGS